MASARRRRTAISASQAFKLGLRFVAVWLFLYTLIALVVAYTALDAMQVSAPWRRSAVVACMVALAFFFALLDRRGGRRLLRMRNAQRIRAAGRDAAAGAVRRECAAPDSKS